MNQSVGTQLVAALRTVAQAYAPGDQVAPCAVLWADPDRHWAGVMPALLPLLPELYQLGTYDPQRRSGPALWLRCIEARLVPGAPATGTPPIFGVLFNFSAELSQERFDVTVFPQKYQAIDQPVWVQFDHPGQPGIGFLNRAGCPQ